MKNSLIIFLIVLVVAAACSNERETASGQKFTIVKQGDGKAVASNYYLALNFMFKDGKDSIWDDTRKKGLPIIMQKRNIVSNGDPVMEVVGMLTKGDSAVFKISAKDLFTKSFRQPVPKKIDSASFFTFTLGVSDVLDSVQFDKFRQDWIAKQNEKQKKHQVEQLGKDTVIIDNYLKEKNIVARKTTSGLRYVITKPGIGPNAKQSQKVKVNYVGYLLNGKFFDSNIEEVAKKQNLYQQGRPYKPIEVVIGTGSVIRGWEEALTLMNKGCKMTVYIPSTLGYGGIKRSDDLVEDSILAFDMEVTDIN